MPILAYATPPRDHATVHSDCTEHWDALSALADILQDALADTDPPEEHYDYVAILQDSLESNKALAKQLAAAGWSFDGQKICHEIGCIDLGGEQDAICIIPSVGIPTGWDEETIGVSFPLLGEDGDCENPECDLFLSVSNEVYVHECTFPGYPTDPATAQPIPNSPHSGIPPIPTSGNNILGCVMVFDRTRWPLYGVSVLDDQSVPIQITLATATDPLRSIAVRFSTAVTGVQLKIRFLGDPPVIRDWTWLTEGGPEEPGTPRKLPAEYSVDKFWDAPPPGFERSIDEELDLRGEWCTRGAEQTPAQRAHQMFLNMDLATFGGDLEASEEADIIQGNALLPLRFWQRAAHYAKAGPRLDPVIDPLVVTESENAHLVGPLERIGEKMHTWMTEVGDETIGLSTIRESFFLFACGEARAFGAHGVPNGVNMFAFTELAIALADNEHLQGPEDRSSFWSEMRVTTAAAAEMFVNCFHHEQFSVCGYKTHHNPLQAGGEDEQGLANLDARPIRYYSTAEKTAIYDKWKSYADDSTNPRRLELEYGRLLASALREDRRVGTPSGALVDINPPTKTLPEL